MSERRRGLANLGRRWRFILLIAAVGGVAGYLVSEHLQPTYRATTTLLVGDLSRDSNLTKDNVVVSRLLASMYGGLIRTQPVLASVVDRLGLQMSWKELAGHVHVDVGNNNTPLITVDVLASSPAQAAAVANAVADRVKELSPANQAGVGSQQRAFTLTRLQELRTSIRSGVRRISKLRTSFAYALTSRDKNQLRRQIDKESTLITDWQISYSSLLRFLSNDTSPNTLQVLRRADAGPVLVRPDIRVNIGLGAVLGILGLLWVSCALAYRRAIRSEGAYRELVLGWPEPGMVGRAMFVQATARVASSDSWVRELARSSFHQRGSLDDATR
jgi:capsular polysaccharide biosynthesis protein